MIPIIVLKEADMGTYEEEKEKIIQNLKDGGCSNEMITHCLQEMKKENKVEILRLLSRQRSFY